jgi:WD40 repeat protein
VVNLLDAGTGVHQADLRATHEDEIRSVAFSPDDSLLLANSRRGLVGQGFWLWDVKSGQLRLSPPTGGIRVESVAFTADGTAAICGMDDGSIQLRDLRDGQLRATLAILDNNYNDKTAMDKWIAYTPEGYYNTPDGDPFVRWRVGSRIVAADKLAKRYYSPDLVKAAIQRTPVFSAALH